MNVVTTKNNILFGETLRIHSSSAENMFFSSPEQQPIRIAMPYANSSFTIRCSHWFISYSATESLSKHCGHTAMPDP